MRQSFFVPASFRQPDGLGLCANVLMASMIGREFHATTGQGLFPPRLREGFYTRRLVLRSAK